MHFNALDNVLCSRCIKPQSKKQKKTFFYLGTFFGNKIKVYLDIPLRMFLSVVD